MTRLARLKQGEEDGMSLVELLVVMLVSSVVLAAVGSTMVSTLKGTKGANSRGATQAEVRGAIDVMQRRIRVAVRPAGAASIVTAATPTSMSFYASLTKAGVTADSPPTFVEYSITQSGSCLQEALIPPLGTVANGVTTYSYPTSNRTTKCIARGRINPGGAALFSYYDEAAAPQPTGPTATAAPARPALSTTSGAVDPAQLDSILSVAITLNVGDANTAVATSKSAVRVSLINRIDENSIGRAS